MPYNSRTSGRSFHSQGSRGSQSRYPARKSGRGARQYIDPRRFIRAASAADAPEYIPENTFADFAVEQIIKRNLTAKGYQVPSPIQDQTIPAALEGKDVIGIANTGTGKTAAFAVPVLNKLLTKAGSKVLIVAPTRELAQQI